MTNNLRAPVSGGSRNGQKQLLAATSAKKSTPGRTSSSSSLLPRRLPGAAAPYSSPKKRLRPVDDLHATDNIPERPRQKARNNVNTPSSFTNDLRLAQAAAAQVEMQARLPQKQQGNRTPFNKPKYRSNTYNNKNYSSSQWDTRQTRQLQWGAPLNAPAGLVNLGNTCYLNAVLQSLFSLPTFPGAINAAVAMGGNDLPKDGVLQALRHCLAERNASSAAGRSAFSPEQVKLAVGRRLGAFRGSFQQDAHEFFCGLLEAVQTEVLAIEASRRGRRQLRASETTDPSTRVFGFAVEHEITCTECNKVSYVTEQCSHLSLDLPKNNNKAAMVVPPGLDSMLSSYFQEESVEKGCEGCGAECVQHTVRHRIKRLPQILALHVKRFQVTFQQSTGTVTCAKVRDQISISKVLRLKQFCVEENLAMPLPPLKAIEQQQLEQQPERPENQKENVELNKSPLLAALSPSPPPAAPAIRSTTFYSGGGNAATNAFESLFSPAAQKQQPATGIVKTFFRKKQKSKGAAITSYWDNPSSNRNGGNSKVHWADKASTIVSAFGTKYGDDDDEDDADLLAAIEASKKDQQHIPGNGVLPGGVIRDEEEDELDADLATALKRSLEEQKYEVAVAENINNGKEEILDVGEAVTPMKPGSGRDDGDIITKNAADDQQQQQQQQEENGDAADNNKENQGPLPTTVANAAERAPPSPMPEIVEDDTLKEAKETKHGAEEETLPEAIDTTPAIAVKQALARYQLTAVINHHGSSAESGHFTAVTHNSTTGQWFRFNDAQVHRIQGDAATNEMAERDCYMLFFAVSTS